MSIVMSGFKTGLCRGIFKISPFITLTVSPSWIWFQFPKIFYSSDSFNFFYSSDLYLFHHPVFRLSLYLNIPVPLPLLRGYPSL